jgi:pyridoxal phosphate enzyme (YggS family)
MSLILSQHYTALQREIAQICDKTGKNPLSVQLIGVSKGQPQERVLTAQQLGLHHFGENRVQEALTKFTAAGERLPALVGCTLHLIGPLQSNKAKQAAQLFDVIHTLDRPELAKALAKAGTQLGKLPRLLIQVNSGREPQKAGVWPEQLPDLLNTCTELGLTIEGLMCIPPAAQAPAPNFAELAKLARTHQLRELSMGMSGDFSEAIAAGATYIRVGRALFGERP